MLASLRYISFVVLFFVIIITVIAGIYLRHSFIDNVVKSFTEDQSTFISNLFTNNVWNSFYPAMVSLYALPRDDWELYPQFLIFKDNVDKLMRGTRDVEKIVLYSPKLEVIYDSSPNMIINYRTSETQIFETFRDDGLMIQNAISGYKETSVLSNIIVKDESGLTKKTIVRHYQPIYVTDIVLGTEEIAKKALAVLEINYNVTSSIKNVETLQFLLIFIVTSSLALVTVSVFVTSRRVELLFSKKEEASMELEVARASAEAESHAKSIFLANVSHELRTPLNAIIGFSEILLTESMGPINNTSYKDFIKDINTSGVHLLGLINDILDFSKAEENKLGIDFMKVDVVKICKMCMRMIGPRAADSKINLIEDYKGNELYVYADSKRLKQAIINLLSNAVKFTPEGGSVTLSASLAIDDEDVVIEISDSGVGIAAKDLDNALSPFGQVDNKLNRRYEGTGLGLPLTKKLIELMNGKFNIASKLGLGTRIVITFAKQDINEIYQ